MASVFRVCGPHAMVSCRFLSQAMLSWVGSGAPATVERSDQDDHLPEDQGCFFDGQPVDERR
mgnify:CR=1 FL=1